MEACESGECLVCRKHRDQVTVAGGAIYEDEILFVSHAQLWGEEPKRYLGYVFIEPRRHVAELADLSEAEAEAMGLLAARLARALMHTEGAEHIYAFVIGDGVPHVHMHLVGRYPGAPREFWGIRVDEWPEAPHGSEREIAEVASRVRCFLQERYG